MPGDEEREKFDSDSLGLGAPVDVYESIDAKERPRECLLLTLPLSYENSLDIGAGENENDGAVAGR